MTTDPTPDSSPTRRAALIRGLGAIGVTALGGGLAASLSGCNFRPGTQVPDLTKPAEPAVPLLSWPSLDKLAFGMVKARLTPGLSLSVMHQGKLLYSKGFGVANYERPAAATPQTGFRIASISKQFTAAAILLLAEQGKLSLDDRLSRFLPDFPHSDTITLAQMLSHTAGLGGGPVSSRPPAALSRRPGRLARARRYDPAPAGRRLGSSRQRSDLSVGS